jgi:hypothetical protein
VVFVVEWIKQLGVESTMTEIETYFINDIIPKGGEDKVRSRRHGKSEIEAIELPNTQHGEKEMNLIHQNGGHHVKIRQSVSSMHFVGRKEMEVIKDLLKKTIEMPRTHQTYITDDWTYRGLSVEKKRNKGGRKKEKWRRGEVPSIKPSNFGKRMGSGMLNQMENLEASRTS